MLVFCLNFSRQFNTVMQGQDFLYNIILFFYLYYKSNKNENKSINRKCNENLTGYCPGKQPFATTRNNNIKGRKSLVFAAFSISIITNPEILAD